MSKSSLSKKIKSDPSHQNCKEWCKVFNYQVPTHLVIEVLKRVDNIQTLRKFCVHYEKYGHDHVTLDKFFTLPKTPSVQIIRNHYGAKPHTFSKRSNVYDPCYIMKRENISYEEAEIFIKKYKESKATTLKNFILKHGEERGTKLYYEWFNKTLKKGHNFTGVRSKLQVEWYIQRGVSYNEAVQLAKHHQYKISPLHPSYYICRGYSAEYAKNQISILHSKKKGRNIYLEYLNRSTNLSYDQKKIYVRSRKANNTIQKMGLKKYVYRQTKVRRANERSGKWLPLHKKKDYELYKRSVWYYTNMVDLTPLPNSNQIRGRSGVHNAYQLDHKYSIAEGFKNNIPSYIIGSFVNLRFIRWEANRQKSSSCNITKEQLYEDYENYQKRG